MTTAELRVLYDRLNDERGRGGQTRLARLLEWDGSTVRRKLSGELPITKADEVANRAVEMAVGVMGLS